MIKLSCIIYVLFLHLDTHTFLIDHSICSSGKYGYFYLEMYYILYM